MSIWIFCIIILVSVRLSICHKDTILLLPEVKPREAKDSRLGLYDLVEHGLNNVYIQRGGLQYLYRTKDGQWHLGNTTTERRLVDYNRNIELDVETLDESNTERMGKALDIDPLVLLSDGGLTKFHGSLLGIYDLVLHRWNDFPVYVQRGGNNFIYKADDGWWYVNNVLGESNGKLKTKDLLSSGDGWFFGKPHVWLNIDSTIRLVSATDPSANCLKCRQITINSTGFAQDMVPEYLGRFDVMEGIFIDGRPVYKNNYRKFLSTDADTYYGVVDAFSGGDVNLRSTSAPVCAFLNKATSGDGSRKSWKVWSVDTVSWEQDFNITVKCSEPYLKE